MPSQEQLIAELNTYLNGGSGSSPLLSSSSDDRLVRELRGLLQGQFVSDVPASPAPAVTCYVDDSQDVNSLLSQLENLVGPSPTGIDPVSYIPGPPGPPGPPGSPGPEDYDPGDMVYDLLTGLNTQGNVNIGTGTVGSGYDPGNLEQQLLVGLDTLGLLNLGVIPGVGLQSHRHQQSTPASLWTIQHNLGFYPGGIRVEDTAGSDWVGEVTYVNTNTITINFGTASFGGTADIS